MLDSLMSIIRHSYLLLLTKVAIKLIELHNISQKT